MRIGSLFQRNQLTPTWSYSTGGVLWRMMFSDTGFILGEDRNVEEKEVSFFCLNAEYGDVLWKDIRFDERWWIGLEAVVHDKVYLHCFKKPDLPEHSKIIAMDLGTGKELWRNAEYAFLYATPDRVVGFRDLFERRKFYEIDAATGEVLQEFLESPEDVYERKKTNHGRTDFLHPEVLEEESNGIGVVQAAVGKHIDRSAVRGHVEYLETEGKLIFNAHLVVQPAGGKNAELLQNTLKVIDQRTGRQLYSDIVNASTPAPVPDSFFLDRSTLYYVKEKKTLVALPIGA